MAEEEQNTVKIGQSKKDKNKVKMKEVEDKTDI